jgi:hypothetical protein
VPWLKQEYNYNNLRLKEFAFPVLRHKIPGAHGENPIYLKMCEDAMKRSIRSIWMLPLLALVCDGSADPLSGMVRVVQNHSGYAADSVSLSLSAATSPGITVVYEDSNEGDYVIDLPVADETKTGVLLSSVAENGRRNLLSEYGSAFFYGTSGTALHHEQHYFIPVHSASSGREFNINVAFAWFPYSEWLGGMTTNAVDNGPYALYSAAPGVSIYDSNDGLTTVTLPGDAGPGNGILLVNSAENEDNYAAGMSFLNTFYIISHDNGADGAAYERDSVAFVYIPAADVGTKGLVAMGRINSDASRDISGGTYTLAPGFTTGQWHLTIPGHSPDTGTLIICPEYSTDNGVDNVVSYEWNEEGSYWVIESRDIPSMVLQDGGNNPASDFFSFAFFESPDLSAIPPKRIYVDASATGAADGSSWDDAFTELTTALDYSLPNDEIWMARGTYFPQPAFGPTDTFRIDHALSIYGGFESGMTNVLQRQVDQEANRTILSGAFGDNAYHVVTAEGDVSGLILDGFEIRDGLRPGATATKSLAGPAGGAGLLLTGNGGTVAVRYCTFRNNAVYGVSGSLNTYGEPQPGSPVFGGALFTQGSISVQLSDSAFYDNTAVGGNGRDSVVAYTTVNPVTRIGGAPGSNGADASGGAVYMTGGSVRRCLFENNRVVGGQGGHGIDGRNGDISLRDGLSGSDGGAGGSGLGGAVYLISGQVTECRFHGNHALAGGGGRGGEGGDGDDGADGADGTGNDPGRDGIEDGFNGYHGGNGGNSGRALGGGLHSRVEFPASQHLEDCVFVGNTVVSADAGDGGDGGTGGIGGNGGDGANTITTGAAGGDGKDGGNGGDGGDGGDLGDALGAAVYFSDAANKSIRESTFVQNRIVTDGTAGGAGTRGSRGVWGSGGLGGEGFLGWPSRQGPNGSSGYFGSWGTSGSAGAAGLVKGAAVYAVDTDAGNRTHTYNSIYWDNTVNEGFFDHFGGGIPAAGGTNIASDATIQGLTGFLDAYPAFVSFPYPNAGGWDKTTGDNDYGDVRLLPYSPAYNAGVNSDSLQTSTDTDLAGNPRILDGQINLGAYEQTVTSFGISHPTLFGNDDDNADGWSNFENYLLGTDPKGTNTASEITIQHSDAVYLVFQQRPNASDGYVHTELSYDLETWFDLIDGVEVSVEQHMLSSDVESVVITVPAHVPQLFMRRSLMIP